MNNDRLKSGVKKGDKEYCGLRTPGGKTLAGKGERRKGFNRDQCTIIES